MGNLVARYVGSVALMSFLGVAATATGNESEIPPEAKQMYEEGKARFDAGAYEEAIVAFTKAYNATGEPNLLFNLAACAERLGDAERAIAYYRVYLEEVPDAEDADAVKARVKLLETEGIPAQKEPEPAPEPAHEPAPEPEQVEKRLGPPPPDVDPREYYAKKPEKKRIIWPPVVIGLGGFVLAGGITTAILAKKEYTGLENSCKPNCSDDDIGTAKALAIASDVQIFTGGAAVIAGVVWLVIAKKQEKQAATAMWMVPIGYPGGGALTLQGRF
jgi:tetratricopeptide (TPR) repeat protein